MSHTPLRTSILGIVALCWATQTANAKSNIASEAPVTSLGMRPAPGFWTPFWAPFFLQGEEDEEPAVPPAADAVEGEVGADGLGASGTEDESVGLDGEISDEDIMALVEAESKEVEAITIIGSAIERKETTTPAPVSVVDKEQLEAAGRMTVGDILQDLPSQSNGINTNFNNGGDGSTRINMRGLGSARTLVLINGRRHVPGGTGANASVDLNAIPLAIIERVEVLKDGASAIYGSDAIGGVVNIITRRDFSGSEVNLYSGTSQRVDGTVYDANFVTGQTSEKGNVIFSAGFSEQKPIFAGERSFSRVDREFDWEAGESYDNGSTAVPNGYIGDDPELPDAVCPSGACYRDNNGFWRDFNFAGNSDTGFGDLYNYQPENYLVTPLRRYNLFSSGNYKLNKHVRAIFEASYMNRRSVQKLAAEPLFTITEGIAVSGESVYNPFGRDLFDVRRRLAETGNRVFTQDINTFRVVAGFDGSYPVKALDGWKWDATFNFGRTSATEINEGRLRRSAVASAIGPSYRDANGEAHCGSEMNPGPEGCVPLDLLGGNGSITDDMLRYLTYTGTANGYTQQQVWQATTAGQLAKTPWDGDITMAVGVSHRRESGGYEPDPLTASGDTTGNKGEPTEGSFNVTSGFGELSVVPVTGHPAAKWLEVNGAARAVNFDTFGSAFTWKAGSLWKINAGVALRGTYGTAFRAPSIGELFAGQSDAFPSVTDPCDTSMGPLDPVVAANCAEDGIPTDFTDDRSQLPARVGGNPNLDPETANVLTAGIVYEPTFAEGLSLTLDYFNVGIDNAIQARGASVILSNCYAQVDRADCDKVQRNPADAAGGPNLINRITDTGSNIGGTDTDGFDFGVMYDHQPSTQIGRFVHRFEGTYLNSYQARFPNRTVEGVGVYDLGVFPRWRFNFATSWGKDGWGVGTNWRYVHHFRECEDDDCDGDNPTPSRKVSINITGDVYANYRFESPAGKSTVALGINNVTDQDPSLIYQGFLGDSDGSTYDYMGRYFYLRFTQAY